MEMSLDTGADPAVEERIHAYYEEELFLMVKGEPRNPQRSCSGEAQGTEVPLLPFTTYSD